MRRLADLSILPRSVTVGALVTLASLPYLVRQLDGGRLLLVVVVLAGLAAVVAQVCLAWCPAMIEQPDAHARARLRVCLLVTGALVLLDLAWLDRWLAGYVADYFPASWPEFWSDLLWVSAFNPLILVAGPYAFGRRLSRGRGVPFGLPVVLAEIIIVTQSEGLPLTPRLVLLGMVAAKTVILVAVLDAGGLMACVLLAAGLYARLSLNLLVGGHLP